MSDQERLPLGGIAPEVIQEAITATRDEIGASTARSDTVPLHNGKPVGGVGPERLWSFGIDADHAPAADTPASLLIPGRDPIRASVVATGDLGVVLGVREELGEAVAAATLSIDAGFVHGRLIERLEELLAHGDHNAELVDALLFPDPGEPEDPGGLIPGGEPEQGADAEQVRAARQAIEPGLRFTWGPPGTGKTKVLAMAVAEAVRRGHRVMVLAHANAAVDVALARIDTELAGDPDPGASLEPGSLDLGAPGVVLRVGTPRSPELLGHPRLLPHRVLAGQRPDLDDRRVTLEAERRRHSDRLRVSDDPDEHRAIAARLDEIGRELAGLTREIEQATRELIDGARVVGATLSKLVIDDQLWSWPSDVVVVDEASMAALPFVLALAMRGATTLSFFGDFRQLPPIGTSSGHLAQQWFGRDVFAYAGVIEQYETGGWDRRLSILRTQFRMGEQICETVNQFAYGGLLRTDPGARNRAIRIAEAAPGPGDEVVVVDVSGLAGRCALDAAPESFSRFNPLSAAMSATAAGVLLGHGVAEVGVVSPYRAQVQLLAAISSDPDRIQVASIHRFQGSERQAIVVDLTDGFDQPGPSRLTGGDPDLALRLLNVAASRAEGKLVIVADVAFLEQRHPRPSPVRQLLRCAEEAGAITVDAGELLEEVAPEAGPLRWWRSWEAALREELVLAEPTEPLDLSLPRADLLDTWLIQRIRERAVTSPVVLRLPPAAAEGWRSVPVDLREEPAGPTPWAGIGADTIVFGPAEGGAWAVSARCRAAVQVFRRLAGAHP